MGAKAIRNLEEYWRMRCRKPAAPKPIRWEYYLEGIPDAMAEDIRAFLAHSRRNWPAERVEELSRNWISHMTMPLRGMFTIQPLAGISSITPETWYAYVDSRLADGISAVTLNAELSGLLGWLEFLQDQGGEICRRMLKVKPLAQNSRMPRDIPPEQLRTLQSAIQKAASSKHLGVRRTGLLDNAWFLLMLHSGMRTGEIRRLKMADIDWERQLIRVEQSKGLKDRLIPFSAAVLDALKAYLKVRGDSNTLPATFFVYRHKPLSIGYCSQRLLSYAKTAGFRATPHQLRRSCATLLLNAGAPIFTVQAILGHKHINTTLGYARLYDGTAAAYYRTAVALFDAENKICL